MPGLLYPLTAAPLVVRRGVEIHVPRVVRVVVELDVELPAVRHLARRDRRERDVREPARRPVVVDGREELQQHHRLVSVQHAEAHLVHVDRAGVEREPLVGAARGGQQRHAGGGVARGQTAVGERPRRDPHAAGRGRAVVEGDGQLLGVVQARRHRVAVSDAVDAVVAVAVDGRQPDLEQGRVPVGRHHPPAVLVHEVAAGGELEPVLHAAGPGRVEGAAAPGVVRDRRPAVVRLDAEPRPGRVRDLVVEVHGGARPVRQVRVGGVGEADVADVAGQARRGARGQQGGGEQNPQRSLHDGPPPEGWPPTGPA